MHCKFCNFKNIYARKVWCHKCISNSFSPKVIAKLVTTVEPASTSTEIGSEEILIETTPLQKLALDNKMIQDKLIKERLFYQNEIGTILKDKLSVEMSYKAKVSKLEKRIEELESRLECKPSL